MPTQNQFNTTVQPYREIDIKITVLDYDFIPISDITGITDNADISMDSDSDIRRTANISMKLSAASQDNIFWNVGNSYWFDKYVQIYVGIKNILTGEFEWVNQGVYMLNNPNISYEATDNKLSFTAVDLMAKLTGMRNGYLEGMSYQILVNSSVTGSIEALLKESGFTKYILNIPPFNETPYEIKVDAGGTVFDLLKELRDVNPNWEMFFDETGTFIFQEIPNGQGIINPNTGEIGDLPPVIDDTIWTLLQKDEQLDTDFEQVKNYVEIYGKLHEPNYWGNDVTSISSTITVTVSDLDTTTSTGEDYWLFGFNLGDLQSDISFLTTPVTRVTLVTKNRTFSNVQIAGLDDKPNQLNYRNESYVFRLQRDASNNFKLVYFGYIQPMAIAWENNPDSPFYVGQMLSGDPSLIAQGVTDRIPISDLSKNPPIFEKQVRIVLSGDEYDNIFTNDLAIDRAKYEIYLRARLHDNITITTVPIYWADVNQIISYTPPHELDENGNPITSRWLVKSISTTLSAEGTQTINAIRYYPLYPSV